MKTKQLTTGVIVFVEVNPNLTKWDVKYDYLRGFDKYGIYDTIKLPEGKLESK